MADIDYPSTLPDFKLGKQRTQRQEFRTSQPFAGPLYTEQVTDESPVTWEVTIQCRNQLQARVFQQFLKQINVGQPFNKYILTENGHVLHEVKFIEMPLTPTQDTQQIWSYSGLLYAEALENPDDDIGNPELVIDWLEQSDIIDVAMNQLWPSA